jgi:hypothetical protein
MNQDIICQYQSHTMKFWIYVPCMGLEDLALQEEVLAAPVQVGDSQKPAVLVWEEAVLVFNGGCRI